MKSQFRKMNRMIAGILMPVLLLGVQSQSFLFAEPKDNTGLMIDRQVFLPPDIQINGVDLLQQSSEKNVLPAADHLQKTDDNKIVPVVNYSDEAILQPDPLASQENEKSLMAPHQVATSLRTGISVSTVKSVELDPVMIVNLVTSDNLDVAISKTLVQQYKWRVPYTGSQLLPSVQGLYTIDKLTGATVILNQTPVGIRRLNQKPSVNLNHRFTPRTIMDIKASHAQYKRAKSQYERTLQEQLLTSLQQYYQWLRDVSANEFARQSLEEATTQRRQNEIRYEAGFGTQLDIEQASVLEAEREGDVLTTENKQIMSGVELASSLNIPLEYPIFPKDERLARINYASILADKPLNELFSMAEKNRPDLKDLTYLIKEAKATFWADLSEALPTVTTNANFGNTGPQRGQFNRTYQRNVTVEANLLNNLGLGLFSRMKMDKARIREAILTKEKEVVSIKNAIAKAYFDLKLNRKQIDVAIKKMTSAQSALKITHARQQHGVGIHLEVVQAETKLAEARQEYLDAVMRYNNAQLQLMFEVGELTPNRVMVAMQLNDLPEAADIMDASQEESVNTLAVEENEKNDKDTAVETVQLQLENQ